MSETVIKAENLGKSYIIGHQTENGSYSALRDVLMQNARGLWGKTRDLMQGRPLIQGDTQEEVWALKDVNFEIRQGEAVGIIGRNGAGKSTLLKILSRITEPSSGRVTINGRVASLLEVGTGFHPELSGRENVYLNGAILGMTRREIKRKFDEIIAFAEVEKYLDTPVKRYSSGMYVRLAFAVAAHLEPEILVVDEVLAVGDAAFQKKCLGKMGDITGGGRTVLFVSHNMSAIAHLCHRVMLFEQGALIETGTCSEVISHYLSDTHKQDSSYRIFDSNELPGDDRVKLWAIRCGPVQENINDIFRLDQSLRVSVEFQVLSPIANFHTFISIYTADSVLAFGSASWDSLGLDPEQIYLPGIYVAECIIPEYILNRGSYYANVNGQIPGQGFIFSIENAVQWEMSEFGGAGGPKSSERPGVVRPLLKWLVLEKPSGYNSSAL